MKREDLHRVGVFAGSSSQSPAVFCDAAEALGRILAEAGIEVVYGAGSVGLMGHLADSALAAGGKVIGAIPEWMKDMGWCREGLTETYVTSSIHTRKEMLHVLSDALVALPGGIGTYEELTEALTWKQIGLTTVPIVIVNINGFYDPLLAQIDMAIQNLFMRPEQKQMFTVVNRAEDVLDAILNQVEWKDARKRAAM